MTDNKLKSLSERINRLLDERDGINGDISDIYLEAKSAGYITKVLRKAIGRMRMDASKRDEEDSILELYEAALDGKTKAVIAELKAGATLSATSEKTGTPRRTVARIAKTVPKNSRNGTAPQVVTPPEVAALPSGTPVLGGQTSPGAADGPSEPNEPAAQAVNAGLPSGPVVPDVGNGQGPEVGTIIEINPGEGAADAAKPVTAQAAAPPEEPPPELVREIDPEAMAEAIAAASEEAQPVDLSETNTEQPQKLDLFQRITGSFKPRPAPPPDTRSFDEVAGPLPAHLRRQREDTGA